MIAAKLSVNVDVPLVDRVHQRLYKNFIEPFDAQDNGISRYSPDAVAGYAKPYDIFDMVADLNPSWGAKPEQQMAQFREAIKLTATAFRTHMDKAIDYERQRQVFEEAFVEAVVSEHPRVLVLSQPCSQWQPLYDLEAQKGPEGIVLFDLLYTLRPPKNRRHCAHR